ALTDRHLPGQRHADHVDLAEHTPRRLAALVARRQLDRVRPPGRDGRAAAADPGAASPAVVDPRRRCAHGRVARGVARARYARGLAAFDAGWNEPALGGRQPTRVPVLPRRLAAPVLD